MKRIISLTLLSLFLTGCFSSSSSSSNKATPLTEGSYAVQTVAADYGSSAVVTGNILGDRSIQQTILTSDKSDFTISTYENILYHIGKMGIDTISQFDSSKSIETPVWSYSANDSGEPAAANPYKVVHVSDSKAYVIRYGSTNVWEINPSANTLETPVTARIDLSAYNNGQSVPHMSDAVYYNGKLFVIMQRLDAAWGPTTSYIAVIDTATNEELETGEGQDGLKGIPLNADNAADSALHNGYLYVAGRGDYTNNSGALDKIDLTTYQIINIANSTTSAFENLNDAENFKFFHITDVAIVDDNNGYILVNVEAHPDYESHIFPFNPTTGDIDNVLDISAIKNTLVSDITTDTNNRLWIAVANEENPEILVYDTDINTQSGDSIKLEMPPSKIEFLTVK